MRCVAYLALRGAADIIAAGALLVSGVRALPLRRVRDSRARGNRERTLELLAQCEDVCAPVSHNTDHD